MFSHWQILTGRVPFETSGADGGYGKLLRSTADLTGDSVVVVLPQSSGSNMENLPPQVIRCVSRELLELSEQPPEGIKVFVNEADVTDVQAAIEGPGEPACHWWSVYMYLSGSPLHFFVVAGTPFEGGLFRVKLSLGRDFPAAPPQGYFLTKIFHPNVAQNGAICVNTLKRDWKPEHGIRHILLVRRALAHGDLDPAPSSSPYRPSSAC